LDYESYRRKYVVDPAPAPRFAFTGTFDVALDFADYEAAVRFYGRVLGPPGYVEGSGTRSWSIGPGWLTLLRGGDGSPRNVEVVLVMQSPEEAERLQAAFLAAGATGPEPTDTIMFRPVRYCPLVDPFGTRLLVVAPLPGPTDRA
jgi:hypothetical protein